MRWVTNLSRQPIPKLSAGAYPQKKRNAKPGMVIYHSYRTVIVNPYADIVVDPLNAEKKPD